MKNWIGLAALLISFSAQAETTRHTVHWDSGVYQKTVIGWTSSVNKISSVNSTTYIKNKVAGRDNLHRNKKRDVIVWIPSTTDLTKDFVMVLWFHGHYGYVPHRTFEDRTLKQLVPLASKKNFVLVIPEMPWSIHTKTPTKRNSLLWHKKGDFIKFVDSIKATLIEHNGSKNVGNVDYRIVGHSAGGSTIKRIGMTGDLCRLNPSVVAWSDSSYGRWLDSAWNGCLKSHPAITVKVFVVKGDTPWRNAVRFVSGLKDKPASLNLNIMTKPKWSHKKIGDNVVKLSNLLEASK